MKDSAPIRLGIIGCGNALDAYMPQCERLRARRLAEVTIACGRESQSARAGRPRFSTDDVLLSGEVDLVDVLTSMAAMHGSPAPR